MWKKIDKTLYRYDGEKYSYAYNLKLKALLIKSPFELPAELYAGVIVKNLQTAKQIVKLIEQPS
jgi:hypothetical protein